MITIRCCLLILIKVTKLSRIDSEQLLRITKFHKPKYLYSIGVSGFQNLGFPSKLYITLSKGYGMAGFNPLIKNKFLREEVASLDDITMNLMVDSPSCFRQNRNTELGN